MCSGDLSAQESFRKFSGSFQETRRKLSGSSQETLRKLSGSSQEAPWGNLRLQGLGTALEAINWCPSQLKCKSCINFVISSSVWEGRYHQVPKITIQNGPRQPAREPETSQGPSYTNPLEPHQSKTVWGINTISTHSAFKILARSRNFISLDPRPGPIISQMFNCICSMNPHEWEYDFNWLAFALLTYSW